MEILGIDIGGSGIKGAPVDTQTGDLLASRFRIPTPDPSRPEPVAETVAEIVRHFDWQGPVGCGFPAVVRSGVALTAANIHKSWIDTDAASLFSDASGCTVVVMNDADAAGMAEMQLGAGRGHTGVVLTVTIGTGLGTALFTNGHLVPNTELGHIQIKDHEAERYASDAVRKQEKLSWKKWSARLDEYLDCLQKLIWPDLIILGGGVSKKHERFFPYLNVRSELAPAQLRNEARIVGAALAAQTLVSTESAEVEF